VTERHDEDDLAVLRYALGGATDDATRAVEARLAAGDEALVREVDVTRLVRDVVEMDERCVPGRGAMSAVRALIRDRHPLPPETDWLVLQGAGEVVGVRAVGDLESTVYSEAAEFLLTVAPREATECDGCGVDGQLADREGEPLPGVRVTWIVDDLGVACVRTDELGEFSFDEAVGASFGLLLEGPSWSRFVRLARDAD